jgi:hypothetical protein
MATQAWAFGAIAWGFTVASEPRRRLRTTNHIAQGPRAYPDAPPSAVETMAIGVLVTPATTELCAPSCAEPLLTANDRSHDDFGLASSRGRRDIPRDRAVRPRFPREDPRWQER